MEKKKVQVLYNFMKKILNLSTNKCTYVQNYQPLSQNEVLLFDDFLSDIKNRGFSQARATSIQNEIGKTNNTSTDFLDPLFEIRKTSFPTKANMVNHDFAFQERTLTTVNDYNSLIEYLLPIIKNMKLESYNILLDFAKTQPHLTFFFLSPAFALVLGPKLLGLINILLGNGNFYLLLSYVKHILRPSPMVNIFKRIPILLKPFITKYTIIPASILGITYLWFSKPVPKIENSSKTTTIPKLPNYRAGGLISSNIDLVAKTGRTAAAEATVFWRTVLSGVLSEIVNGYQSIIQPTDKSTKTPK